MLCSTQEERAPVISPLLGALLSRASLLCLQHHERFESLAKTEGGRMLASTRKPPVLSGPGPSAASR